MVSFYLSLGANIGDRFENIKKAISLLQNIPGITIERLSSIYETEPIGYTDQPSFLNMVIGGQTELSATELLKRILDVEIQLGRIREIRWGPRTIDIDILTYGMETLEEEWLEIPHPRMLDRLFVLIPMEEIAAHHLIPIGPGQTVTPAQELQKVTDKSGVHKWKSINWETELEHSEN